MYREILSLLTVISIILIAIVISQILFLSFLLAFLLIISLGLFIIGNMFINHALTTTNGYRWIEKPPKGMETVPIITLTGLMDLVWVKKKAEGKREFVYNGQEATVIDKGDFPLHFPSGAHGFLAHEGHDMNVNPNEVKAADTFKKIFKTNDLKEMYKKLDNIAKSGEFVDGD